MVDVRAVISCLVSGNDMVKAVAAQLVAAVEMNWL
jgi:hypothetical protein